MFWFVLCTIFVDLKVLTNKTIFLRNLSEHDDILLLGSLILKTLSKNNQIIADILLRIDHP